LGWDADINWKQKKEVDQSVLKTLQASPLFGKFGIITYTIVARSAKTITI
jgi:hypothetical protein